MPESRPAFLSANPTREDLLRAVAANHRRFLGGGACAAGGALHRERGLTWTHTPGARGAGGGEAAILFPRLDPEDAGRRLDALLRFCREQSPALRSVSCWSLLPAQPPDLGALLTARGFEWGWQPHWMWLDLAQMPDDLPLPEGLRVAPAGPETVWDVEDLPYYSPAVGRPRRRLRRFGAWQEERVVGHSTLFLTTGRLGVAGIYDVGVVPAARGQGVGKAVSLAACRHARALGCRHALLNATPEGERVYRKLGFVSLGHGQTWWLHRERLEAPPPSPEQVAFAEAIGRGDVAALARGGKPEAPDAPLACGMTPLELAVAAGQPGSAEWLLRHGALAGHASGPNGVTPLHTAAWDNRLALIRVLLDNGADPTLRDSRFQSTPAGWARHNNSLAAAEMIEEHLRQTAKS